MGLDTDAGVSRKPPILNVPFEILYLITEYLDADDLFSLGLACSQLREVLRDSSICRTHLKRSVPFAPELGWAPSAGGYGRSLHARTKRRHAIANLKPFAAAVVAYADAYLYLSDTLVYVRDRVMRILHLGPNTTVRSEQVVDVRALLDQVLPESEGTSRYAFQPIHYADGIVSCIYAHHRPRSVQENWLVFFQPETGWGMNCRIPFPHHRLFVRNDKKHLVYGIFTSRLRITAAEATADVQGAAAAAQEPQPLQNSHHFEAVDDSGGADNHRHWRLRSLDIEAKKWSSVESYRLDPVLGLGGFGKNICFEIIDGYFYAVASEQRFLDRRHQQDYTSVPHRDDYYIAGRDGPDADMGGGDYYIDDFSSSREAQDSSHRSSGSDGDSNSNSNSDSDSNNDSYSGSGIDEDKPMDQPLFQESSPDSEDTGHNATLNDTADQAPLTVTADDHEHEGALTRAALFRKSSFFSCFRFRITNENAVMEQPTLKSRWRRRNDEGALDDRWSTLKLQKSAETGDILVIEERKEWLDGSGSSRRTYYTQPLVWPSDLRQREYASRARNLSPSCTSIIPGYASPSLSISSGASSPSQKRKRLPLLSDLLPRKRLAQDVHFGDDVALVDPPTLGECFGRFYSRDASAFVDVVNQDANGTADALQIGLRAGSRALSQANELTSAHLLHPTHPAHPAYAYPIRYTHSLDQKTTGHPVQVTEKAYVATDVVTWPMQQKQESAGLSDEVADIASDDRPDGKPARDAELAKEPDTAEEDLLGQVLNPRCSSRSVISAWDERLLVYSTKITQDTPTSGKPKSIRAVVVVSFDPTLCLPGIKVWQDRHLQDGEPRLVQGKSQQSKQYEKPGDTEKPEKNEKNEHDNRKKEEQKGEEKDTAARGQEVQLANATMPAWTSMDEPSYLAINNGYDFSYHVHS